ncbi:MAG: DUF255 domain-containing protein [Proteobacteria bacterium]|nr:DUF255 domain-containing protein [Pseudomonadota bacterium]
MAAPRAAALRTAVAALGVALLFNGSVTAADSGTHGGEFTNRLVNSADPYLLLHAHNPVDWYPWGAEALERARREDKPIFLSVGYSTCFWCHVAERTIYSNPAIAKLMNDWFINIKVDREERPDIDQVYMLATEVLTGQGGWPNNVFLTPDLQPFYAGSYFAPTDDPAAGPGFPTVLRAMHEAWTAKRSQVLERAASVGKSMRQAQSAMTESSSVPVSPADWANAASASLLSQFDETHAGFGTRGPKFPRAPELELLLAQARIHHDAHAQHAALQTLDAIFYGGIHDHLAGGFHRYSTEPTWSIPHFEKMLYDNAQLLRLYAEVFELTGNPLYRYATQETAHYLLDQMSTPAAAGFFTAQDSQVDGVEGSSYVWTREEIVHWLGDDRARRFFKVYELTPIPRQAPLGLQQPDSQSRGQPGVLRIRLPIERTVKEAGFQTAVAMIESLASDRAALLAARERRPQPARDEKILTGLNGLAISAFTVAGRVLHDPSYIQHAQDLADRVWKVAYDPKTNVVQHESFRGAAHTDGFLPDYAELGQAFMALAVATGDTRWRERATLLADAIVARFERKDGSFALSVQQRELLIPPTEDGDGDTPSGTSGAIDLLLQLASTTQADPRFASGASRAVNRMSGVYQQSPAAWGAALVSLNLHPAPGTKTVQTSPPAPSNERSRFAPPVTADHLHISASANSSAAEDQIVVTVAVDPGYHINANPASFDYLIPTSVQFSHLSPIRVKYPDATRFKAEFAPAGLNVYEGAVQLRAIFPSHTLSSSDAVQGIVTAQACDLKVCLPPSKIAFLVKAVGP